MHVSYRAPLPPPALSEGIRETPSNYARIMRPTRPIAFDNWYHRSDIGRDNLAISS